MVDRGAPTPTVPPVVDAQLIEVDEATFDRLLSDTIHVPEFAHAEDLMIEPDGTRVPADAVQREAAKDLVR